MNKVLKVIILLLLLVGCFSENKDNSKINLEYERYRRFYDLLTNQTDFDTKSADFDIKLVLNKTNKNNIRYDVIIDNPKVSMYDIKAIVMVQGDSSDSVPTLGLLEEEVFSLIPNYIDKENNIYKGVNLSGITSLEDFKVIAYITYNLSKDLDSEIVERYIILDGNDASR